jgi:hypothetical protein
MGERGRGGGRPTPYSRLCTSYLNTYRERDVEQSVLVADDFTLLLF